ncbi:hypothetical protein Tco_1516804 [Tanacetum coccineum]
MSSRGQVFDWEAATYGKIRYFEDIDYFKNFETEFPAIVYKDALTSKPEVSSEPTVNPNHINFEMSFSESDDEDYTFINNKDSFSYKLIFIDDLKPDKDKNDNKIDDKLSSNNISAKPLDSVLDFDVLTEEMGQGLTNRLRMEYTGADGQVVFTSYAWRQLFRIRGLHIEEMIDTDGFRAYWVESLREIASKADLRDYWTRISSAGDFLSTFPSYTLIREPLRRLCHSMDEGTLVNVPYLLAYYMFRHASGRKQGARMSECHFIARLRVPFRVITNDSLRTLTVAVRRLTTVDVDEHVRAVARATQINPEGPKVGVVHLKDAAPQMPLAGAPAPKTVRHMLQRL